MQESSEDTQYQPDEPAAITRDPSSGKLQAAFAPQITVMQQVAARYILYCVLHTLFFSFHNFITFTKSMLVSCAAVAAAHPCLLDGRALVACVLLSALHNQ